MHSTRFRARKGRVDPAVVLISLLANFFFMSLLDFELHEGGALRMNLLLLHKSADHQDNNQ